MVISLEEIIFRMFLGSDVRTKSFFSPPSYSLLLVRVYMGPSYHVVWCGD